MRTTIFNFLMLQMVIWAIVFSGNEADQGGKVNYAVISDTWQVTNTEAGDKHDVVVNDFAFNKLTLDIDGTYTRITNESGKESGSWSLNERKTVLTLNSEKGVQKFDIVQLPDTDEQTFIIKENNNLFGFKDDFQYELTRM